MSLTKEECEEALMNICSSNSKIKDRKVFYKLINEHNELSNQLVELSRDIKLKNEYITELRNYITQIEREFKDNPPLKFEELKEGDWIWDSKHKEYIECNPGINSLNELCALYWYTYFNPDGELEEDYIKFEENRFYRYEVKE